MRIQKGSDSFIATKVNTMQNVSTEQSINEQIISVLSNAEIKFDITSKSVGLKHDSWECDGWMLKLTSKGKTEFFDYFTGMGHRKVPGVDRAWIDRQCGGSISYKYQLAKYAKPVTPEICDIIHSLNIDSQAMNESFPNWCDNFGYDSDSIKALNVYNACCNNAKKYFSVIDRKTQEKLEVILQDY